MNGSTVLNASWKLQRFLSGLAWPIMRVFVLRSANVSGQFQCQPPSRYISNQPWSRLIVNLRIRCAGVLCPFYCLSSRPRLCKIRRINLGFEEPLWRKLTLCVTLIRYGMLNRDQQRTWHAPRLDQTFPNCLLECANSEKPELFAESNGWACIPLIFASLYLSEEIEKYKRLSFLNPISLIAIKGVISIFSIRFLRSKLGMHAYEPKISKC